MKFKVRYLYGAFDYTETVSVPDKIKGKIEVQSYIEGKLAKARGNSDPEEIEIINMKKVKL